MMKAKHLLLIVICLLEVHLFGQDNIDFSHKTIQKEIKKALDVESFDLQSSPLNNSCKFQGKYFTISAPETKYVYIGRVNSCRAGGCSTNRNSEGASEYFDYFILYDEKAEIKLVKIFNYAATHGQEVTAKGWLKQFNGHDNSDQLEVGKNIDSISGATISVFAITADVKEKTTFLNTKLTKQ